MLKRHKQFAGVIGWPLDHTLSPVIHNAALRALDLDWIYLAWPVPPEMLKAAVDGLRALGAMGANVTMPHKEAVVASLDGLSGDARTLRAVNTIQRIGTRLIGHNTDVDGFRSFLISDAGLDASGKRAVVLGAGGAARAVVAALTSLAAESVAVVARRPEQGALLAELGEGRARAHPWAEGAALASQADLIVNATPLGVAGEDAIPSARFTTGQAVVDLVYARPATPLLESARSGGAEAWGGLGMLVHQAAASIRIWTGQRAPIEAMSAAAIHALGSQSRGA
jgi:shikimate dehydrogenase